MITHAILEHLIGHTLISNALSRSALVLAKSHKWRIFDFDRSQKILIRKTSTQTLNKVPWTKVRVCDGHSVTTNAVWLAKLNHPENARQERNAKEHPRNDNESKA